MTALRMEVVAEKDVATLGIAMATAYGCGLKPSFEEMIKDIATKRVVEPSRSKAAYYRDMQELFLELYEKLESEYKKLAEIKSRYSK